MRSPFSFKLSSMVSAIQTATAAPRSLQRPVWGGQLSLSAAVLAAVALTCSTGAIANTPVAGPLGPSPETAAPLAVSQTQPQLVMLTVGRDRTLFNEAYNDASDIDGDGGLDIRFNRNVKMQISATTTLWSSHKG